MSRKLKNLWVYGMGCCGVGLFERPVRSGNVGDPYLQAGTYKELLSKANEVNKHLEENHNTRLNLIHSTY